MTIIIQRSAFFEAIQKHNPSSTAVINHDSGAAFSYGTLLGDVARAKERLLQTVDRDDISGERIAFLVENGYSYVVTLLSAFACNAIAVPLAPSFPTVELRHVINNSGAIVLLASSRYAAQAKEVLKEDIGVPVCLSGIPDFQEVDSCG